MIHTRPDLIGEPFGSVCEKFLSGCPSEPWEVIEKIMRDELRQPLDQIFQSIDETPLGAASVVIYN